MQSLSQEYITLFNSITNALADLQCLKDKLVSAQITAESLYIEDAEQAKEAEEN